MKKRFTVTLVVLICAGISLSACSRNEEIEYRVASQEALNEALMNPASQSKTAVDISLKEKIGLTETTWNEEVKTNSGAVSVNAEVIIPDTRDMYTMVVKEHYPYNDDKRRIASVLFDEGSVRVNIDRTPSRQWANKVLEMLEEYKIDNPLYENMPAYCDLEIENINRIRSELPDENTLSEDIGDYSANHYIGKRDGIEYILDFYIDQDTNRSVWSFRAKNSSDLHEGAKNRVYQKAEKTSNGENICKMTEAESMDKAEKLANDLGFAYMKSNYTNPLEFFTGGDTKDYNTVYDGYTVVLTRSQGNTITDGFYHMYYNTEDEMVVYDSKTMTKPYERERLCIGMNDTGIYSIASFGWMEDAGAPHIANLMTYQDAKECLRTVIKEEAKDKTVEYEKLYLTYARVPDEKDKYQYLPAWRLAKHSTNERQDIEKDSIWISAVDGSRIYPVENGDVDILNPDDLLMEFVF